LLFDPARETCNDGTCSPACDSVLWDRIVGKARQQGHTTAGRRDKSGSPLEPQAIGMAWVRACRSVGARAAPDAFANEFNCVFGTAHDFISAENLL
jgi:hypothetical protein